MNYYGKSPLEMRCPHCDRIGAHPVIRTEQGLYHWGKDTVALFERIAGKDISYRRRVKRCAHCARSFVSIEMANQFLEALIKEVQQLEGSLGLTRSLLRSAVTEREKLEADQKETHKAIRAASNVLHRRLPKRKKQ